MERLIILFLINKGYKVTELDNHVVVNTAGVMNGLYEGTNVTFKRLCDKNNIKYKYIGGDNYSLIF